MQDLYHQPGFVGLHEQTSRTLSLQQAHRVLVIIIAQITEERYMDRDGHRKYEAGMSSM